MITEMGARPVMAAGADSGPKRRKTNRHPITFTEGDQREVGSQHDDALVVEAQIGTIIVSRLLIDTGSSCDILFLTTVERMGWRHADLTPCAGPVVGFTGHTIPMVGTITLPMTLGKEPRDITRGTRFVVVDVASAYNGIIGRPYLTAIEALPSLLHQMMKFRTSRGVGLVRGN